MFSLEGLGTCDNPSFSSWPWQRTEDQTGDLLRGVPKTNQRQTDKVTGSIGNLVHLDRHSTYDMLMYAYID